MHRSLSLIARRTVAIVATTAAITIGVSACSGTPEPVADPATESAASVSPAAGTMLAAHGLDGLDTRTIVDTLDTTALAERPEDLIASVRPEEVLLTDANGNEASIPMPEDAFYVSFAPYVDTTHECYFHSLTTCVGELQDEQIDVLVTDAATGEVLVDETMTTFDNGFVGIWLPRDIDAEVTIERDGLSASTTVSTSEPDDATCITTMQLA